MAQDWFEDVLAFHRKFGCAVGEEGPRQPHTKTIDLRMELIREEWQELHLSAWQGQVPDVADALADLIYVAIGMAISYGIDLRPVWAAVHAANMAKVGGPMRADGKILKPTGWMAPDIEGILAAQKPLTTEETR